MKNFISKNVFKQHASLLSMLIYLTFIFVATQIIFFIIHYNISNLLESLTSSTLNNQLLHPFILLPLVGFLLTQLLSYTLFIAWIWFIATASGELCKFSRFITYLLGIALWFIGCIAILTLNNDWYPNSFFSQVLRDQVLLTDKINFSLLLISGTILSIATLVEEIETDNIVTNKVLQKSIGIYQVDPKTGFLTVLPAIEHYYQQTKQQAIMQEDWLLTRIPASTAHRLTKHNNALIFKTFHLPAYFVLVNMKTLQWTIGLTSPLAKQAPIKKITSRV